MVSNPTTGLFVCLFFKYRLYSHISPADVYFLSFPDDLNDKPDLEPGFFCLVVTH